MIRRLYTQDVGDQVRQAPDFTSVDYFSERLPLRTKGVAAITHGKEFLHYLLDRRIRSSPLNLPVAVPSPSRRPADGALACQPFFHTHIICTSMFVATNRWRAFSRPLNQTL